MPNTERAAPWTKGNTLTLVCGLTFLSFAQPGYGSHRFPDYPVRSAGEYTNKVLKTGLVVAVEPVEAPEQQKIYFNSHLTSKGILPVFIVVQNTSDADVYLFDKSAAALGETAEIAGKGARKVAALLSSGGLIDLTQVKEVTDVRENLMKKEVRSKTLSPHSSLCGFIYVPVPADVARAKVHLQLPLTNSQTGEITVVNLFF